MSVVLSVLSIVIISIVIISIVIISIVIISIVVESYKEVNCAKPIPSVRLPCSQPISSILCLKVFSSHRPSLVNTLRAFS